MSISINVHNARVIADISSTYVWRQLAEKVVFLVDIQPYASQWSDNYLTASEKRRCHSFRQNTDRINYLVAHSVVNKLFSEWLGCSTEELPKGFGAFQKPRMDAFIGVDFNISHTKGYVVVAFYTSAVGVDAEYIDDAFDYISVSEEAFTTNERKRCEHDRDMFYRIWVAKEAYLKRLGIGLHRPMTDIEVITHEADWAYLADKVTGEFQRIKLFSHHPNTIAGICVTED